jgi:ribonuclease HI
LYGLGGILQNADAAGRVAKWSVELMGRGITYTPQEAIKSQALVDFVAEWTESATPSALTEQEYWTMYFDGSLMKTGAGAGLVFVSPLGVHLKYLIRIHFPISNNVAEYEALVNGLHIAIQLGIRRLDVRDDSQLVINQVMKESSCHDPKMVAYCQVVRRLEDKFDGLELNHIVRRYNEEADQLAKIASRREAVPIGVFANDLYKPSVSYPGSGQDGVEPPPVTMEVGFDPTPGNEAEAMDIEPDLAMRDELMPDWRIPYLEYLIREVLPADKTGLVASHDGQSRSL